MGRSSLAQLLPSSRLLDFWTLIWHHHLDLCFPVNQWRHIICDLLNIPCPPSIGFMLLINVLWIVWDELKLIWQSESELPIFGKLIQIYMGWNGGTYLSIKTSFHVCACKAWKKAGLAMAHTNYHALSTPFLSSYIALGIADIRHPLSSAGAVNAWELPCNEAAHSSVSVRGTAKKPHSESYLRACAWGYQLLSP